MPEGNDLATRQDGGEHRLARPAEQDENHVGRRLLESLEEGVGRRGSEQVDAIEDVDLLARHDGRKRRVGDDLANLLDKVAVHARRSIIVHVGVLLAHDAPACIARAALPSARTVRAFRAHEGLSESVRRHGLVGTGGADEQVGVRDTPPFDARSKEVAHAWLPEYVLERIRHDALLRATQGDRARRRSPRCIRSRRTSRGTDRSTPGRSKPR